MRFRTAIIRLGRAPKERLFENNKKECRRNHEEDETDGEHGMCGDESIGGDGSGDRSETRGRGQTDWDPRQDGGRSARLIETLENRDEGGGRKREGTQQREKQQVRPREAPERKCRAQRKRGMRWRAQRCRTFEVGSRFARETAARSPAPDRVIRASAASTQTHVCRKSDLGCKLPVIDIYCKSMMLIRARVAFIDWDTSIPLPYFCVDRRRGGLRH
eukprot:6207800-Pleurochrysis_carterae.AAC.1